MARERSEAGACAGGAGPCGEGASWAGVNTGQGRAERDVWCWANREKSGEGKAGPEWRGGELGPRGGCGPREREMGCGLGCGFGCWAGFSFSISISSLFFFSLFKLNSNYIYSNSNSKFEFNNLMHISK